MGYPAKLLDDGEEVDLDLHPHWRVLVLPALALPVVVGAGSYGAAIVSGPYAAAVRIGIGVLALLILLLFCLRRFLIWVTTSYVVTTHRVAVRTGLISRTGRDIPLSRINDVTYHHSLIERLFGSGTLTIESAGERGQIELEDVPHVEPVQRTIYQLVEADDERRRGAVSDERRRTAPGQP